MQTPILIAGPSGVGKSHFCRFLESQDWLYLEADPEPPEGEKRKDGIDENKLRKPWNSLYGGGDAAPLAAELNKRMAAAGKKSGVVLSLPGGAILPPAHISKANGILRIRFLYGDPRACLASFIGREKAKKSGLDENHWNGNNQNVFKTLSTSQYHSLLVDVFRSDGSRLPLEEVSAKLMSE